VSPTLRRRSNCQTKKLKSGYEPNWGPGTKTNWPTDSRSQCNLKLNLRHCTANYRPVLSSERVPYMKNKESNCHSNKCNICSKRCKTQRWTGLTVGRNVTSTSTWTVQWLTLALSKGPNKVGVCSLNCGRKQIQCPKRCVLQFSEYRTMVKIQKHSNHGN
jgi:hypothetical protein